MPRSRCTVIGAASSWFASAGEPVLASEAERRLASRPSRGRFAAPVSSGVMPQEGDQGRNSGHGRDGLHRCGDWCLSARIAPPYPVLAFRMGARGDPSDNPLFVWPPAGSDRGPAWASPGLGSSPAWPADLHGQRQGSGLGLPARRRTPWAIFAPGPRRALVRTDPGVRPALGWFATWENSNDAVSDRA